MPQGIIEAEKEIAAQRKQQKARDEETRQFLEEIKRARKADRQKKVERSSFEKPVETIHRRTDYLSEEELNEQINQLQSNISRQIKKQENIESVIENRVDTVRQIQTSQTNTTQISSYDIERMIEDGVKSQMNTISNQVMNKLERQMRNEKIRRGYN